MSSNLSEEEIRKAKREEQIRLRVQARMAALQQQEQEQEQEQQQETEQQQVHDEDEEDNKQEEGEEEPNQDNKREEEESESHSDNDAAPPPPPPELSPEEEAEIQRHNYTSPVQNTKQEQQEEEVTLIPTTATVTVSSQDESVPRMIHDEDEHQQPTISSSSSNNNDQMKPVEIHVDPISPTVAMAEKQQQQQQEREEQVQEEHVEADTDSFSLTEDEDITERQHHHKNEQPVHISSDDEDEDEDDEEEFSLAPSSENAAAASSSSPARQQRISSSASSSKKRVSSSSHQEEEEEEEEIMHPEDYLDEDDSVPEIRTVFSSENDSSSSLRNIFGIQTLSNEHIENLEKLIPFSSSEKSDASSSSPSKTSQSEHQQTSSFRVDSVLARREEGRCLVPLPEEELLSSTGSSSPTISSQLNKPTSQSIQLGFFKSRQHVINWSEEKQTEIEKQKELEKLGSVGALAAKGNFRDCSLFSEKNNNSNNNNNNTSSSLSNLPLWSDLERIPFKKEEEEEQQKQKETTTTTATSATKTTKTSTTDDHHTMNRSENLKSEPKFFNTQQLLKAIQNPSDQNATLKLVENSLPGLLPSGSDGENSSSSLKTPDITELWNIVRDIGPREQTTRNRFWTSDYNNFSQSLSRNSSQQQQQEQKQKQQKQKSFIGALLPAQFSRGVVLRLSTSTLTSQFHDHFSSTSTSGNAILADPVFCSLCIYVMPQGVQATKLTETMYWRPEGQPFSDTDCSLHFPSFVTFIPNEFKHSRLLFLLRVHRRLAGDSQVVSDMYVRPGRYGASYYEASQRNAIECTNHAPTQGPLLQQLGFAFSHVTGLPTDESYRIGIQFDKLYTTPKNLSEQQTLFYITHDSKRTTSLKEIQFKTKLSLQNVSKFAVTVPKFINQQNDGATAAHEDESVIRLKDEVELSSVLTTTSENNKNEEEENNSLESSTNTNSDSKNNNNTSSQKLISATSGTSKVSRYIPCCRPLLNAGCFTHYSHVMYLRLSYLNLSKVVFTSHRTACTTFAIQCCLKDNDETLDSEGLPCFYIRNFGTKPLLTSEWSSSSFNTKDCEFHDEFKIQLPLVLKPEKHHLFFTIHGYSSKCTADPGFIVGYAALPLFSKEGVLLDAGHHGENIPLQVISVEAARQIESDVAIAAVKMDQQQQQKPSASSSVDNNNADNNADNNKNEIILAGGYLSRLLSGQLSTSNFFCDGIPILGCSIAVRSTITSTNSSLSKALNQIENLADKCLIPPTTASEKFLMDSTHRVYTKSSESNENENDDSENNSNTHLKPSRSHVTYGEEEEDSSASSASKTNTNNNGTTSTTRGNSDKEASKFLSLLNELAAPEQTAFAPLLINSCLAIICSQSQKEFSLSVRADAMRTFITMASRIHSLEVLLLPPQDRAGSSPGASVFLTPGTNKTTTLTLFLYNYLTRDLFFNEKSYFVIAPLFVDVLCYELARLDTHYNDRENYVNRIIEVLWFVLDVILRDVAFEMMSSSSSSKNNNNNSFKYPENITKHTSSYMRAKHHYGFSVNSNKFLNAISDLITLCVKKLARGGTLSVVQRLSIFLRSLMFLFEKESPEKKFTILNIFQKYLEQLENRASLQSSLAAIRFWLDCGSQQVLGDWSSYSSSSTNENNENENNNNNQKLVPVPQLFLRIILRPMLLALFSSRKDLRAGSIILLYNLVEEVSRIENNNNNNQTLLLLLASQLLPFLHVIGNGYINLRPLLDKHSELTTQQQSQPKSSLLSPSPGWSDRRLLAVIIVWILHYCPREHLENYLKSSLFISSSSNENINNKSESHNDNDDKSNDNNLLTTTESSSTSSSTTSTAGAAATGIFAFVGDCVMILQYTSSLGKVDRWNSSSARSSSSSSTTISSRPQQHQHQINTEAEFRIRQSADLRISGIATLSASKLTFLFSKIFEEQISSSSTSKNNSNNNNNKKLEEIDLRTVGASDTMKSIVFPFFRMLELLVAESQPTVTIQISSLLVLHIARMLFVDILQGRARMAPGMVLLAMRLVMSSSKHVRFIAAHILVELSRIIGATNMLLLPSANNKQKVPFLKMKQFKTLSSAAIISIAESYQHGRDMTFSYSCVDAGLSEFVKLCQTLDSNNANRKFLETLLEPKNNNATLLLKQQQSEKEEKEKDEIKQQQEHPGNATFASWCKISSTTQLLPQLEAFSSSSSETETTSTSTSTSSSSSKKRNSKQHLLNDEETIKNTIPSTEFSTYISSLVNDHKSLFKSISALPLNPELKIKGARPTAFLSIVEKFIDQKALRDVSRWIVALQDTNRTNCDYLEAALSNLLHAAFGYRVSQLYRELNGDSAPGLYLPPVFFSMISWHDYVRLFPHLETLLSVERLYPIVSDAITLPDNAACFVPDGQLHLLKSTAEMFGKALHYEHAIHAIKMVDSIVLSREDYLSVRVVSGAVNSWVDQLEKANELHPDRLHGRYFVAAISFSDDDNENDDNNENTTNIKLRHLRIFRYQQPTTMNLTQFKKLAKEIACARYHHHHQQKEQQQTTEENENNDDEDVVVENDLSTLNLDAEHFNLDSNRTIDDGAVASSVDIDSDADNSGSSSSNKRKKNKTLIIHCFEIFPLMNAIVSSTNKAKETPSSSNFKKEDEGTGIGKSISTFYIPPNLTKNNNIENLITTNLNSSFSSGNTSSTAAAAAASSSSSSLAGPQQQKEEQEQELVRRFFLTKSQMSRLSPQALKLNAKEMKKKVIVLKASQGGFPNVSTNILVERIEEHVLDPISTANEIISEQQQIVNSLISKEEFLERKKTHQGEIPVTEVASGEFPSSPGDLRDENNNNEGEEKEGLTDDQIISGLFRALTPLEVIPAGYYFTHCVRTFQEDKSLRETIKNFAESAQRKLEKVINVSETQLDHMSMCWKGVVDVEIACKDVEDIVEQENKQQ